MVPRQSIAIMSAGHPFVKAVASALRWRCGVREGDRLLLAVSGGADSVALLPAVCLLTGKRSWNLRLAVAHVHHHLRPGRSADLDAKQVETLAAKLGLPFLRKDLDGKALKQAGNVEAAARSARYEALLTLAKSWRADAVVAAHHGDDQLETLLMRLLRGTSPAGLSCIAWRRPLGTGRSRIALIRPLLAVDRAACESFLRDLRQRWRDDPTNADASRWRARLRRDVLPVLREMRPDAAARAVQLSDHARDLRRFIGHAVARHMTQARATRQGLTLARGRARVLDPVILTPLLRKMLQTAGVSADRLGNRQLAPIVRAVRDHHGGIRLFDLGNRVNVEINAQDVIVRGDSRNH